MTARRIVMLSRRDPGSPAAGGAERFAHLALQGLVEQGDRVVWHASAFRGGAERTVLDGVEIVRSGRGAFHVLAAARFLRRQRGEVDLVIDHVNGYPMFAPVSYRGPCLVLIHQLARELWFHHLAWPAALAGYVAEPLLLAAYARLPTVTVSTDTARDLFRWGFRRVRVVHNAVEPPAHEADRPRSPPPRASFAAIGRLVPGKRLEDAVEALCIVRAHEPSARLTIIGRGEGAYARWLARKCRATPGVALLEDASDDVKWRVLASSTALIATSVREGWGLMASEAHAVGTPVVAYDVHGLRVSTRDGVDGLVCPPSPAAAAEAMLLLARDCELWSRLSRGSLDTSRHLTVDTLKSSFAAAVDDTLWSFRSGVLPPLNEEGSRPP